MRSDFWKQDRNRFKFSPTGLCLSIPFETVLLHTQYEMLRAAHWTRCVCLCGYCIVLCFRLWLSSALPFLKDLRIWGSSFFYSCGTMLREGESKNDVWRTPTGINNESSRARSPPPSASSYCPEPGSSSDKICPERPRASAARESQNNKLALARPSSSLSKYKSNY